MRNHLTLITVCVGGVFLVIQKRGRYLQTKTTESFEHMLGMAHSWKKQFTVNEFIIYSNEPEIILKKLS